MINISYKEFKITVLKVPHSDCKILENTRYNKYKKSYAEKEILLEKYIVYFANS